MDSMPRPCFATPTRAMYIAKNRTKNELHFFTPDAAARRENGWSWRRVFAARSNAHEFQMFYQPQVDLDGRLASLEALLVWDTPEFGRVSPSEFIPIAEDTGMILPIGEWVLQRACGQIAAWREAGLATVPLAVNVSALQFAQPDFVGTVANALTSAQVPADCLELELTESLIMRDVASLGKPDAGTSGYRSQDRHRRFRDRILFAQLSATAPCGFAEDRPVVSAGSEFGPATLALVKSIVVLAHNIGLSVTAEGIETTSNCS